MTPKIKTTKLSDSDELHSWQGEDGYYACYSGFYQGLISESEDVGPFDSREDAEAAVLDAYEEVNG